MCSCRKARGEQEQSSAHGKQRIENAFIKNDNYFCARLPAFRKQTGEHKRTPIKVNNLPTTYYLPMSAFDSVAGNRCLANLMKVIRDEIQENIITITLVRYSQKNLTILCSFSQYPMSRHLSQFDILNVIIGAFCYYADDLKHDLGFCIQQHLFWVNLTGTSFFESASLVRSHKREV